MPNKITCMQLRVITWWPLKRVQPPLIREDVSFIRECVYCTASYCCEPQIF